MLYDRLNQDGTPVSEKRRLIVAYLKVCAKAYRSDPDQGEQIAYDITGLTSTSFALGLQKDDTLDEIFYIASQLELPAQHRDEVATWDKMEQLINQLP